MSGLASGVTEFGPPLHIHHAEDELVQIVEGTRWVQGDEAARMLTIFTPGGEQLFVESGVSTKAVATRGRRSTDTRAKTRRMDQSFRRPAL